MASLDEPGGVEGLVFASYEEAKETHGSKRFHKFFLVDASGTRHLAATGEDTGDAHYNYSSSKPFSQAYGAVASHNRKDVLMWLEGIINESGGGGDGAAVEAIDSAAHARVFFVEHRNERTATEDGRRVNKWYLVDQHGTAHLAVVGVERETKDGHYAYHAEEPFASLVPLVCSNQAGVFKWLERMLTHHHGEAGHGGGGGSGSGGADLPLITPAALAAAAAQSAATGGAFAAAAAGRGKAAAAGRVGRPAHAKAGGGAAGTPTGAAGPAAGADAAAAAGAAAPAATPGAAAVAAAPAGPAATPAAAAAAGAGGVAERPKPLVIDIALLQRLGGGKAAGAGGGGGGGGGGAPRSKQKGSSNQKNKPVGIVEQNQQKRLKKLQEDARAEEAALQAAHLAALRRAAAAEAAGDAAARRLAVELLCAPPGEEERVHLGHWITTLRELPTTKDKLQQKHSVRIALECLKELSDVAVPLATMAELKAVDAVRSYASHAHPAVRAAAARLLDHWRAALAGHAHVLSCPAYVTDPSGELELDIAAGRVPLPALPQHRQAALAAAAAAGSGSGPGPGAAGGGGGGGAAAGAAGFLTPPSAGGGGGETPASPGGAAAGAGGAGPMELGTRRQTRVQGLRRWTRGSAFTYEAVSRGNALGKGPVLFRLGEEGLTNIKKQAAAGDERFGQLELDMYRLAGLFLIDRMRQQFEVEALQGLTRAAPDYAALDAATTAAAADASAFAAAAAPQPPVQRSGTITGRRVAWARAKMACLFTRLHQQLGRAELLQLAPGASVTQTTSVLLLAGGLQCAPELPEAAADAPPADAARDAVRWLCSAGRHQAQGLLPAFWELLSAEDIAAAPAHVPRRQPRIKLTTGPKGATLLVCPSEPWLPAAPSTTPLGPLRSVPAPLRPETGPAGAGAAGAGRAGSLPTAASLVHAPSALDLMTMMPPLAGVGPAPPASPTGAAGSSGAAPGSPSAGGVAERPSRPTRVTEEDPAQLEAAEGGGGGTPRMVRSASRQFLPLEGRGSLTREKRLPFVGQLHRAWTGIPSEACPSP
ncbi:hypothetical protein Rsub_10025 [Raphidocelis subcapitata]|uniref:TFIIS N-terminal domain-containing protein n=1 Tax=Raphidocelis subcapitata TaxID=307507 RepID=A0A2V0PBV5_9CHLO|nr:hypothetical protein Rsub_10025 [Raphidocelis subcapitata]|eukprot:GBF97334.1 hypothetical protein Rsub_10025 [Raphidocelis subcapitata]